jgi:hypothetical protein
LYHEDIKTEDEGRFAAERVEPEDASDVSLPGDPLCPALREIAR